MNAKALKTAVASNPTAEAFSVFEATQKTAGIRPALAYLAARSDYRFVGIYRFDAEKLVSVAHHDKLHPDVERVATVPVNASYCCFVRDSKGSFAVNDSLADAALAGHPKRAVSRAYCGVPILDPEGQLLGALCHYDAVPRDAGRLDLDLLRQVASALAGALASPKRSD